MKFTLAAIAIFLSAASADNCHEGIRYCAYNLIGKGELSAFELQTMNLSLNLFNCETITDNKKGDYHSHVRDAMESHYGTKNLKYFNADYALFKCNGPDDISFSKDCNSYCQVGQDGPHDDHCDN